MKYKYFKERVMNYFGDTGILECFLDVEVDNLIKAIIIKEDININKIYGNGFSILDIAVYNQNIDIIKEIIQRNDISGEIIDSALYWTMEASSRIDNFNQEIFDLIQSKRVEFFNKINELNLTFFDTETTGLDIENDVIIQIAYINEINGKEFDKSVSYYSNGDRKISLGSKVAHGIIEEQLIGFEEFSEDSKEFEFIKNNLDKTIFIAHNAKYDVNILKKYGLYIDNYIDTLRVAKYLMQDYEEDFEYSYKEQNLKYYLMEKGIIFPDKAKAHDAMGDIEVLRVIFYYLFTKIKELFNLDDYEIISKMSEITFNPFLLKRINFGKYKGLDFKEITIKDPDYLDWLYREEIKKIDKGEENIDLIYTCKTLLYGD